MKHCLAAAAVVAILAQHGFADENRIFLLQVSPLAQTGNSLFADQSRAIGSIVRGVSDRRTPLGALFSGAPALQYGSGNRGDITLHGAGTEVRFSQQGLAAQGVLVPGHDNSGTVLAQGNDQFAMLNQLGSGNSAEIRLRAGNRASAALHQLGDDNTGSLRVRGTDTRGTLIQSGSNINSALSVRARGADVTYRLNGSNISAPQGVVVVTNVGSAGPITITQSQ